MHTSDGLLPPPTFGLPADINAYYICNGRGTASLDAAAAAWGRALMATEKVANSLWLRYLDLKEEWSGEAATLMLQAFNWFWWWYYTSQRELGAANTQTYRISGAYEEARRTMHTPESMRAIRDEIRLLLQANNDFGLGFTRIPELEYAYNKMLAENLEVMQTYSTAVSNALSELIPWKPPPPITTETGLARQGEPERIPYR